jgi:hypothetical protein
MGVLMGAAPNFGHMLHKTGRSPGAGQPCGGQWGGWDR